MNCRSLFRRRPQWFLNLNNLIVDYPAHTFTWIPSSQTTTVTSLQSMVQHTNFHNTIACRGDFTQNLPTPTSSGTVKKVWWWLRSQPSSILCEDGDPVSPLRVNIREVHHRFLSGIKYRDCCWSDTGIINGVHDGNTVGDPVVGDGGIVACWYIPG